MTFSQFNSNTSPSAFGLFDDNIVPTTFEDGAFDPSNYELGTKFVSSQNGSISALKYYRGAADADDTDARTLRLWSDNGTLLGSVTITSPPGKIGWQVGTLASPIAIAAGKTYVVSYGYVFNNNSGALESYAITENFFSTSRTSPSGTLTAPFSSTSGGAGVYSTNLGSIPTQTWNASNYWVDVAFSASGTSTTQPSASPSIPSKQPSAPSPIPSTQPSASPSIPSITLTAPTAAVAEDGTANLIYTFTRSGSTSSTLSVNYSLSGTATNGTDYAAIGTSVTFAANSATATVTVNPTADTAVESNETVALTLAAGSGYAIGTSGAVTGTITNDDGAPSAFGLFADNIVPTAFKSGAIDRSNYELGTKFVSSQNGSISALKYYRGAADADDTDARTLRLWSDNGTLLGSVTITSPPGKIGWQVGTLASPIAIAAGKTYVVSYGYVSNNNSGALESYAVTENYFSTERTSPSGTLTAPFSSTSRGAGVYSTNPGSIPTQTWNASNYWVDVAFSASGTSSTQPSASPSIPSITLTAPTAAVAEDGTANLIYTFTRSGNTSSTLSVNYSISGTATNGTDYAAIGTSVTFAANSATATLTMNPTADTAVEPNETVALTLATGSGYSIGTTGAVTGTITNDDQSLFTGNVTLPTTGWTVNEFNVGLAPFGIVGEELPVYTGPYEIPAGSFISGMRFTGPVSLHQGDIVIEKSIFQPLWANRGDPIVTTTEYASGTFQPGKGKVVIRDSEFDGSLLSTETAAYATGFHGIADMQRNYFHTMGGGFALYNTGRELDSLIEHNYVTDMIPWGDHATTGNHIDAFTIRDFTNAQRADRQAIIRNNRFDAEAYKNVTGAFFIQPLWERIDNVLIEGNYLEGAGLNLSLEQKTGYSNMRAINNRFRPTGWGASRTEGPGWTTWQDNYIYDAAMPYGIGVPVQP